MEKVFELKVDIFTSNLREKILIESKNEIEAISILRNNFYDFWCDYFSKNIFYEYSLGKMEEVEDIENQRYKDSVIFSKDGFVYTKDEKSSMSDYYERYGYNKNQLSLFK
jgi:hypothetical protein